MSRSRYLQSAVILFAGFVLTRQLVIQQEYIWRSIGDARSPGAIALRGSTEGHLVDKISQLRAATRNPRELVVNATSDISLDWLTALSEYGRSDISLEHDFVGHSFSNAEFSVEPGEPYSSSFARAFSRRSKYFTSASIAFGPEVPLDNFVADTRLLAALKSKDTVVVGFDTPYDAINRFWWRGQSPLNVTDKAFPAIRDSLYFYPSTLGDQTFGNDVNNTLFLPEPDPFFPGHWFQGINRYTAFAASTVSSKSRVLLSFTRTPYDRGATSLPQAALFGKHKAIFGFVGSGSGRLFSPLVTPKTFKGLNLFLLDVGVQGKPHITKQPGIFSFFNGNLLIDHRYLAGYVRDISIVSDDLYHRLSRPSAVMFPGGLDSPSLEYSGIYEDGWASKESRIILGSSNDYGTVLEIRGSLPRVPATDIGEFPLDIVVGKHRERVLLPVGSFTQTVNVPRSDLPTEVDLRFEHPVFLDGDGRTVGALLYSVGFQSCANDLTANVPASARDLRVDLGSGWSQYETYLGEAFRWSANEGAFLITSQRRATYHLSISIEGGPAAINPGDFTLKLLEHGRTVAERHVAGRGVVNFQIDLPVGQTLFTLHVNSTGKSVGADPRVLTYRVFGISVH